MSQAVPATLSDDDAAIVERVHREMQVKMGGSRFSLREKIALACRHLAEQGHGDTLAGQISVRQDDGTIWTTNFGAGFADACVSNLVRVDEKLEVVEGEGLPNPAVRFHLWVYAKRPEVRSMVHTHPPYASVLAMSGQPLLANHMDMMMFHEDLAFLRNWPGVPLANEEGRIISAALGEKNAILLANHGILTVGETLEHAVFRAVHLELAARLQVLAASAGYSPIPVADELAAEAKAFVTKPSFMAATFDYWARLACKRHPDALA